MAEAMICPAPPDASRRKAAPRMDCRIAAVAPRFPDLGDSEPVGIVECAPISDVDNAAACVQWQEDVANVPDRESHAILLLTAC